MPVRDGKEGGEEGVGGEGGAGGAGAGKRRRWWCVSESNHIEQHSYGQKRGACVK